MRFTSTLVPLLCATLATSRSLSFFGNDQSNLVGEDSLSVPGENPLSYCADPSKYILTIDKVDLDPNPPHPGGKLTIKASGVLHEDVDDGAYILVQVKYGLITLVRMTADLCEEVKNVDLQCPLKKGPMTLTKEVEIPSQVPKGKYTVKADVFSADDDEITCLDASVYF